MLRMRLRGEARHWVESLTSPQLLYPALQFETGDGAKHRDILANLFGYPTHGARGDLRRGSPTLSVSEVGLLPVVPALPCS